MFVNLTDVFTSEGKTVAVEAETELRQIEVADEVIPFTDVSPVSLTFTNIGKGRARIVGHAKVTLAMRCDRCLRPVEETLDLSFDREVFAPDISGVPQDDQEFMNGYEMDVDDFLHIEIVINLPMKVLCKPDCRGICRQCGKDLNTGTCDCDTFVPDPRMAAIKDIFNGNKEV